MSTLGWIFAATGKPDPGFDPDSVTPQWVGFAVTFLIAVITVLLIMDMTRRIRRVRYREDVQAKLAAEREGQSPNAPGDGPTQ